MSKFAKQVMEKYEIFLVIFLGLQPLIDVLTTYSLSLNINVTFGILIRFLILFISIVYIFLKSLQLDQKKYIYYFLILFCVLAVGVVNNFNNKPIFSVGDEGKFIVKVVYLLVMLCAYLLSFKSLSSKLTVENKLMRYLLLSSLIINIVFVISIATGTSLTSYDFSKIGYSGWFFAGNEIGAILAISFPVILLYSIRSTVALKDIYKWIPSILMIFSMLAVGTKVGYGACLISLLVSLVMSFYELFQSRRTPALKTHKLRSLILSAITIMLILITPFTPIYKNTFTHLNLLGIDLTAKDNPNIKNKESEKKTNNHHKTEKQETINKKQIENLVLSSRDVFLDKQKNDYQKAPISQKLFGLGYAGNYTDVPKMIEMDFYDIFFSFGIVGSLVLIFPLIYLGFKLIFYASSNLKKVFNLKYALYVVSLLLAFGIAFSAGHVLTAPAVSIYISAIFAFLLVDLQIKGA
ncbi:O-antigen ligase family protein [Neobacillus sp. SAB-20_R2A]|uniref:O-antigen ligase family protein n=1 Tax=Neobacillus sp. SAB-20_R2A TaxID=3120519 RepID=UPI003C6E2739